MPAAVGKIGRTMSVKPASKAAAPDFDIQHDDEFEDFQVKGCSISESTRTGVEWIGDWDDDIVEDFATVLQEQRALLNS
jgi:hypothetical protein